MSNRRHRALLTACLFLAWLGACRQPPDPHAHEHDRPTLQQAFQDAYDRGQLDVHGTEHSHTAASLSSGFDSSNVRADIRDAAVAQMYFRSKHGRYAVDLAELDFKPRMGVTLEVTGQDSTGTSLIARSSQNNECAMIIGTVDAPRAYVARPRQIFCKDAVPAAQ